MRLRIGLVFTGKIMLIEAGCLNGGGQIKPISGQSPKELSHLLESVYMENVSIV